MFLILYRSIFLISINNMDITNDEIFELIDKYGHDGNFIKSITYPNGIIKYDKGYSEYILSYHKIFGWTEPTKNAIDEIAKFVKNDTVLEIGAGVGLVTKLLENKNINITAIDNYKKKVRTFADIKRMDHKEALKKYKKDVLLLVFPSIDKHCYESLKLFRGNKLVLIGETLSELKFEGMHCDEGFFVTLKKDWVIKKTIKMKTVMNVVQEVLLIIRK